MAKQMMFEPKQQRFDQLNPPKTLALNHWTLSARGQGLHAELQFTRYEAALSKLTFLKLLGNVTKIDDLAVDIQVVRYKKQDVGWVWDID